MNTADILLHPVRVRIVQALVGRRLTPLEIKDDLDDVPQASLYRHLNKLADAGLIEVVEERPVRGGVERTYTVVEGAIRLGVEDFASAGPDEHRRYFAAFVGSLLAGFDRYVETGELDYAADGVGYQQTPMWLTDEEFAEMAQQLASVLEQGYANEQAPNRRRRLVSTIIFPSESGTDSSAG